jgi:hypothetical protein
VIVDLPIFCGGIDPMTTPVGSGAVDNTPDRGGSVTVDASGYAGADLEEAPDARQGRMHVPGEAPSTVLLDGPARMTVGAKNKSSKSNKKK